MSSGLPPSADSLPALHTIIIFTVFILCVCPDLSQGGLFQGPTPMTSFNFNFLFKDPSPNTITLKKHNSACKWVTPFKERDQTGRSHPRHPGSGQDILMKIQGMVQPQASSKFLFKNNPLAYEAKISKLIKYGAERPSSRYFQIIFNDECPRMSLHMRVLASTCKENCHYFLS